MKIILRKDTKEFLVLKKLDNERITCYNKTYKR
jgi:hypothetical protein